MSTPPSLGDTIAQILGAIQTILYEVASGIAANAATLAEIVVLGGMAFIVMKYGTRLFRGVTSWFSGLF
jgi:hypothetical protein